MKTLLVLNAFYLFYVVIVGLFLLKKRVQAVKNNQIDPRYFKTYQGEIPKELKVLENHFNNQFQVPVFFMITSLFAIQTQSLNLLIQNLACLFVLTRLIHTYIHLTNNKVLLRAASYFIGVFCVVAMWILILFNAL